MGNFFFLQVSDGGVHAHINHLESMIDAAKELGVPKCYVQFFADGRDTSPTSGGTNILREATSPPGYPIVINCNNNDNN